MTKVTIEVRELGRASIAQSFAPGAVQERRRMFDVWLPADWERSRVSQRIYRDAQALYAATGRNPVALHLSMEAYLRLIWESYWRPGSGYHLVITRFPALFFGFPVVLDAAADGEYACVVGEPADIINGVA